MWNESALHDLIQSKLSGHRFIAVANREPYIHRFAGGSVECVQPASGLATALHPIMQASGGVWIAHGSGDADHLTVDSIHNEHGYRRLRRLFADVPIEIRQAVRKAYTAAFIGRDTRLFREQITGDGRTAVKASYSRYALQVGIDRGLEHGTAALAADGQQTR